MNIISHIRESGKTVRGVCIEAGITPPTFYAAIKPGGNPTLETIKAIARVTGLSPSDICPELKE
jgi:DNA-binding phage protein